MTTEESDRKRCLIVTGLPESSGADSASEDLIAAQELFNDCESGHEVKSIVRLGRKPPDPGARPRLVKVVFESDDQATAVMRKKANLKDHEKWKGVFVRRSLSPADRELLTLCLARCRQLNSTQDESEEEKEIVRFFVINTETEIRIAKRKGQTVLWDWFDKGA